VASAKYAHLLNNADIKRWYENLARESKVTADLYVRRLGNFCASHKLTPEGLPTFSDKQLADLLMDTVTSMESQGLSGGYIETVVKVVRSWLSYNHRYLKASIKIKGARETPSLKDAR